MEYENVSNNVLFLQKPKAQDISLKKSTGYSLNGFRIYVDIMTGEKLSSI